MKDKQCSAKLNQTQCTLPHGHSNTHQDSTGRLKWYNQDRPNDDQGFMVHEDK